MSDTSATTVTEGDEVMRAAGELRETARQAAKHAAAAGVSQEEVKSWLTVVFEAIKAALK